MLQLAATGQQVHVLNEADREPARSCSHGVWFLGQQGKCFPSFWPPFNSCKVLTHHPQKSIFCICSLTLIRANSITPGSSGSSPACQLIWHVNRRGSRLNRCLLSNYGQQRLHQRSYLNLHEPPVRLRPAARVISLLWLEAPERLGLRCLSWYNTTAPINAGLSQDSHCSAPVLSCTMTLSWEQQPDRPPQHRARIFSQAVMQHQQPPPLSLLTLHLNARCQDENVTLLASKPVPDHQAMTPHLQGQGRFRGIRDT